MSIQHKVERTIRKAKSIALIRTLAQWAIQSKKSGEGQAAQAFILSARAAAMTLKGELE